MYTEILTERFDVTWNDDELWTWEVLIPRRLSSDNWRIAIPLRGYAITSLHGQSAT